MSKLDEFLVSIRMHASETLINQDSNSVIPPKTGDLTNRLQRGVLGIPAKWWENDPRRLRQSESNLAVWRFVIG